MVFSKQTLQRVLFYDRVFYKLLGYTQHTRSISADLAIKQQDSSLCSKRFSKKQTKFSLKRQMSFKLDSKSSCK